MPALSDGFSRIGSLSAAVFSIGTGVRLWLPPSSAGQIENAPAQRSLGYALQANGRAKEAEVAARAARLRRHLRPEQPQYAARRGGRRRRDLAPR